MLWLRTSDTETDRTKPTQTCITSGINEPESSPELVLGKNEYAYKCYKTMINIGYITRQT